MSAAYVENLADDRWSKPLCRLHKDYGSYNESMLHVSCL